MNERELLELTAKAIGGEFSPGTTKTRTGPNWETWEWTGPMGIILDSRLHYPLTDNGDAFRVAADLSLDIQYDCYPAAMNDNRRKAFRVRVWAYQWFKEDFDDNSKMEAIRRVIVQAAANIGRRFK
ncbi:hypothetical protein D3C85_1499830 [compost metagenome]